MAATVASQNNSDSVVNIATGKVTTDAATAVAVTLTLGFVPRRFEWVNVTSTAAFTRDTVYDGMTGGVSVHEAAVATTPAADQTTILSTTGPVINSDGTVTIPAALAPASSTFYFAAMA